MRVVDGQRSFPERYALGLETVRRTVIVHVGVVFVQSDAMYWMDLSLVSRGG
jgi:hypothetical protein